MKNTAKEYRQELAEMFLHLLQEEGSEWVKEWNGSVTSVPINAKHMARYKGINRFRLMLVALDRGYKDPRWATFNQIKEMGYHLENAKGAGVKVEYWYPWDKENKRAVPWKEYYDYYNRLGAKNKISEKYLLKSKYSIVFNGDLIAGLPLLPEPERHDIVEDNIIPTLSGKMDVKIFSDGGNNSYYDIKNDTIHLPEKEFFLNDYAYNSTALHELAHATGAGHRLNRNMTGAFGSEAYAFEELIAEMTSCFMSVNLTMEQDRSHIENHKAYVRNWMAKIKEKPEYLVKAIAEAEKVSAYLEEKAGIISIQEYELIEQGSREVAQSELEEPNEIVARQVLPEKLYRQLPEGGDDMRKEPVLEIWVGNLARYVEGHLEGEWLELPMQQQNLTEHLNRISRNREDEIMIMDVLFRKDCTYLKEMVGEWSNIDQINMAARLIGEQTHPAVEAYVKAGYVSNLSELANALLQENMIPFYRYQFEGSDNPEVMESLTVEEKLGYTKLESTPDLKKLLDTVPLGTSTLGSYVDAERIGMDFLNSGLVTLSETGWIDPQAVGPDLSLYTTEELLEEAFNYSSEEQVTENVRQRNSVTVEPQAPIL